MTAASPRFNSARANAQVGAACVPNSSHSIVGNEYPRRALPKLVVLFDRSDEFYGKRPDRIERVCAREGDDWARIEDDPFSHARRRSTHRLRRRPTCC
jgi:hypothetical protein